MAKFMTTGLITAIRGRVGDLIFTVNRGRPCIMKKADKVRDPQTEGQIRVRRLFGELNKEWGELELDEKVLWEEYAKRYRYAKFPPASRRVIRARRRGPMSGQNAYLGVNSVLIDNGFEPRRLPMLGGIPKPSLPFTDLKQYGKFKGEVRFKIWLPREHPYRCVAQIWIKRVKNRAYSYIAKKIEVSTTPIEVVINSIRVHRKKNEIVEVSFRELKKSELHLQIRTAAETGEFSMCGAVYTLQVKD